MVSNCLVLLKIISHGFGFLCGCLYLPGHLIRGVFFPGIFGCQSQFFLNSSSRAACIKHTLSEMIWHLKGTCGPSYLCCACSVSAGQLGYLEHPGVLQLTTQHMHCSAQNPHLVCVLWLQSPQICGQCTPCATLPTVWAEPTSNLQK